MCVRLPDSRSGVLLWLFMVKQTNKVKHVEFRFKKKKTKSVFMRGKSNPNRIDKTDFGFFFASKADGADVLPAMVRFKEAG